MALEATREDPIEVTQEEPQEVGVEAASEEAEVTVESLASDIGWHKDGKNKFGKSVSPEDFIRQSKTIQTDMKQHLEASKQEMHDMKRGIDDLKVHNERVLKATLERQRKEIDQLKSQKREAIEEGDPDRVEQIEGEMLEKYDAMEEPASKREPEGAIDPVHKAAYAEWESQNSWYRSDKEMTDYADSLAREPKYAHLPYERKISKVTELVRDAFPDKFPTDTPEPRVPVANAVEAPQGNVGERMPTRRDLSRDQQAAMDTFIGLDATTEKKYIRELREMGEI